MQFKSILVIGFLTTLAAFSMGVNAASDKPAEATTEPKATESKAEPVKAKGVKPHSHIEEKTGVQQKTPEAMPSKYDISKDRTRHYHPRDGK